METSGYFDCVRKGDLEGLRRRIAAEPGLLAARTRAGYSDDGPEDCTALHLAAHAGRADVARVLVDAGIELEATTTGGRTALHEAVELSQMEVQRLLIERGARIDVCLAAILGRLDVLRELLDADPELANDRATELSPLGWAAYGNQVETATELLERGARMDDGELLCAASVGHVEVGRLLIARGADPELVHEPPGGNALHVGVSMQHTQRGVPFVRMLLDHGVDRELRTSKGETALDIARRLAAAQAERMAAGKEDCPRPFDEVVALLEEPS